MPKISAPTVAEHRERVLAAIVRSAGEVLDEKGYGGLTLGEVASRAGIARTSIYDYYVSKEDVLLAVFEEAIPVWVSEIEQAAAEVETPREKAAACIDALLGMAADGRLEIAAVSRHADLSKFALGAFAELVKVLLAPFAAVAIDLGQNDPDLAGMLLLGLLDSAIWQISQGVPADKVTALTISLALDGLDVKSGNSGV